nr:16S rRNA pseudouridine(516) synthase [Deltaproteobacteria bacterium]
EGRYHQVKRMFHARGNEVEALSRVAFGPQTLDLPLGTFRVPTPAEERAMYSAVSLVSPDCG